MNAPAKSRAVSRNADLHTVRIETERGGTILAALRRQGIFSESPCGGKGTCGKCRVRVCSGSLFPPDAAETAHLEPEELRSGIRLACQARAEGGILEVCLPEELSLPERLPDTAGRQPGAGNLEDGIRPDVRPDAGMDGYGVACDLGTTTVVCTIADLASGACLATRSMLNEQRQFGHDVLTRISCEITEGERARIRLQEAAIRTLDLLIGRLLLDTGIDPVQIRKIHVAGNCTMIHMLLGEDARGIGRAPYRPAFLHAQTRRASDIGIRTAKDAEVYCLPQASAFVGGDITAGLRACGLDRTAETELLVDIGTNGEMVLASGGALYGCSCAAGPALEGMSLSCGMRALPGAVEDVRITDDGEAVLSVIGGGRPSGICGSGILSLVRELLRSGLMRANGALLRPADLAERDPRRRLLVSEGGKKAVLVSENPRIPVTQEDLRQVQLAKGAILSGIEILLEQAGIRAEEPARVCVAGQFGSHLPADVLTACGILPREMGRRVEYVGNTAKSGAYLSLVSEAERRGMEALAERIRSIDLNGTPGYDRRFVACLRYPEEAGA